MLVMDSQRTCNQHFFSGIKQAKQMASRVILYASSRAAGNTAVIATYLSKALNAKSIDLSARPMAPFSYEDEYPIGDAYISTIEEIIDYDEWILMTPVYWYTMSAQMKIFLDRFSDLIRYRKDLMPPLAGKGLWAISVGSDGEATPHFFAPFELSAGYLDMNYLGDLHTWVGREPIMKPAVASLIDQFIADKML